ncbi:MAG: 3-hydroxyacyl-CoA dehydrogenase NAD-binding domain-containing protein [Candidatus Bathyarchaeia archaeon]
MEIKEVRNVRVIGVGQMDHEIGAVFVRHGHDVILMDTKESVLV